MSLVDVWLALLLCCSSLVAARTISISSARVSSPASKTRLGQKKLSPTSSNKMSGKKRDVGLVVMKEFGAVQVAGHPLSITYRFINSTPHALDNIRLTDTSFSASSFRPARANTEQVKRQDNDDGHLMINVFVPTLGKGDKTVKTVTLVPLEAETFVDKPASVAYRLKHAPSVSKTVSSTSKGLFTISASLDEHLFYTQGGNIPTSAAAAAASFYYTSAASNEYMMPLVTSLLFSGKMWDANGRFAWENFAIFQEWRQRTVIGCWAAFASALPMYWFERMRDDALASARKPASGGAAGHGASSVWAAWFGWIVLWYRGKTGDDGSAAGSGGRKNGSKKASRTGSPKLGKQQRKSI